MKDIINYPDTPVQIEKDLSKYEEEMSKLINNKFLLDDEIKITKEEDDRLKLFLAIMAFRSVHAFEKFSNYLTKDSNDSYLKWQPNGDFSDFWKRNLGYLVNCRSIQEVIDHKSIDEPIKTFMLRDTESYFGMYFVVSEVRGKNNYVIGDCYPTVVTGTFDFIINLHLYSLYPISPTRMIILVSDGAYKSPQEVIGFDKSILRKPYIDSKNLIHINVKKMYDQDVERINNEIIKCSHYGYIYKN